MAAPIDVSGLFSLDSKKLIEAHEMVANEIIELRTEIAELLEEVKTLLSQQKDLLGEIKEVLQGQ